jgi:neutral ceramidase
MIATFAAALALAVGPGASPRADVWQAGVAKVAITPREPLWMAGYAARDHPSEGVIHDLWAKVLALQDPLGRKAVLVTLDVCGIDAELSKAVRDAAKARFGLERDRIVIACSHTHSGPVLGGNLASMYVKMDEEQRRRVEAYTKAFTASIDTTMGEAFADMMPAVLFWGTGRADFAVNRRENKEKDVPALRAALALKGPVDHDLPVLRVMDEEGGTMAIVFGYACHCTVLDAYKFSGDYAGSAQLSIEKAHPGTQAMFVAGCGADQNPIPRRSVELAEKYGGELAVAVEEVLASPMHVVEGPLASAYEEIPLPFASLPTREELERATKAKDPIVARRAQRLLSDLQAKGKLEPTYPYPAEAWRLGELTWIFLGGEVVVDYSLRLKRNLGTSTTWVSGYCNDVMAYIPSLRVLKEGGYEGGGAMLYYGLPSPWGESVEEDVVGAVGRLIDALGPKS